MDKIEIGDAVVFRGAYDRDEVYLVSGIKDYSERSNQGEYVENINYEIIMILPVNLVSEIKNVKGDLISLYQKIGSAKYNHMMSNINHKRNREGFNGKPDFVEILSRNNSRRINYSDIDTIDGCLDAMNTLEEMSKVFKDKQYTVKREKVKKRLEALRKEG